MGLTLEQAAVAVRAARDAYFARVRAEQEATRAASRPIGSCPETKAAFVCSLLEVFDWSQPEESFQDFQDRAEPETLAALGVVYWVTYGVPRFFNQPATSGE